jgi:cytochrome b subunit of formate dehydrogenase
LQPLVIIDTHAVTALALFYMSLVMMASICFVEEMMKMREGWKQKMEAYKKQLAMEKEKTKDM